MDIAERPGEVERMARFAEEVHCVGCCWMGTIQRGFVSGH